VPVAVAELVMERYSSASSYLSITSSARWRRRISAIVDVVAVQLVVVFLLIVVTVDWISFDATVGVVNVAACKVGPRSPADICR